MKRIKRWRYYCDFCKKSGGSGHYMKIHEKGCTANPDRECGFCKIAGLSLDKEKLKQIVKTGLEDFEEMDFDEQNENWEGLQNKIQNDLIKESGGCPACSLAAVRQTKDSEFVQFDYKKAKDAFWLEHDQRPTYEDCW